MARNMFYKPERVSVVVNGNVKQDMIDSNCEEKMRCFWIHNWSVWSNLGTKRFMYDICGKSVQGVEHHQTRTCVNCNLVQKREL